MRRCTDDTTPYDVCHLRHDIRFETFISHDVYWIPVSSLGQTRYTNEVMSCIAQMSPMEKKKRIDNLYEAAQLFCIGGFQEALDAVVIEENGRLWEHHKPGFYAVSTNRGCCASAASFLNYLLDGSYDRLGLFCFSRPNGSGHVMNCIWQGGYCYLFDLLPFLPAYRDSVRSESGVRTDYLRSKYITPYLVRCKNPESYASFYSRIQRYGGYDHLFFYQDSLDALPISTEIDDENATIFYPNNGTVKQLLRGASTPTMRCQFVSPPLHKPDWQSLCDIG